MGAVDPSVPDADQIIPPTYNSSGIVVTSGTPGASSFDGPWFVEEQGMNISYNRVPAGSLSSFDLTLSGSTITHKNDSSKLACVVTAYYKSYKDWSNYNTSAWQQPQKFEFVSFSADPAGNTYGTLNASTLGPMGSIITNQPYYNRRAWADVSGDVEVTKQMNGANYFAIKNAFLQTSSTIDPVPYAAQYEYWWMHHGRKGSLLQEWDVRVGNYTNDYYIPGVYATSQENLWQTFSMIDQIGQRVTNLNHIAIPANRSATGYILEDQGFPEYRITRHDYS